MARLSNHGLLLLHGGHAREPWEPHSKARTVCYKLNRCNAFGALYCLWIKLTHFSAHRGINTCIFSDDSEGFPHIGSLCLEDDYEAFQAEKEEPQFYVPEPAIDQSEGFAHIGSLLLEEDDEAFQVEKEEPQSYVPAPTIDLSESKLNKNCEDVLYILKDILPGSLRKGGIARERFLAAYKILSADIQVQDPLLCMRGAKSLRRWLKILAHAGVVVDLHEIYMQSCRTDPCKRWVYAVLTLSFTENIETLSSSRLPSWWREQFYSLLEGACSDQSVLGTGQGTSPMSSSNKVSNVLRLSGDSKFELDRSGQVISIMSSWYVRKGEKEIYEAAKFWLAILMYMDNNQA